MSLIRRPERPHTSRRRGLFLPDVTQHFTMLAGNLLHTGVTRGKRLVVLVC